MNTLYSRVPVFLASEAWEVQWCNTVHRMRERERVWERERERERDRERDEYFVNPVNKYPMFHKFGSRSPITSKPHPACKQGSSSSLEWKLYTLKAFLQVTNLEATFQKFLVNNFLQLQYYASCPTPYRSSLIYPQLLHSACGCSTPNIPV